MKGQTKRMCLNDLNPGMWAKLRAEDRVAGYFCAANAIEKKKAAKEFITLWCAAIARNEGDDFLTTMGWYVSTPRGEKRALEDTAVAAEEIGFADTGTDTAVAVEDACLAAAGA